MGKKAIRGKTTCLISIIIKSWWIIRHETFFSLFGHYFLPGGFVGARSPLCFVGKPLDFGIPEFVGGGILPVLLP
jgi:hypothetical protein